MSRNDFSKGGEGTQAGEPLEIQILRSIRRIIRAIELDSKKLTSHYQITGPQLRCLAQLEAHGRQNTVGLARALHLSASTVVGILDRLEGKSWIERKRDPVDRRVTWSKISPAGRALLLAAPSPLQETLSRGLETLSVLERTSIALSLERLVGLIEAEDIDAAPFLETGPIGHQEGAP